ncbi:MAG: hypothetical protein AB1489_36975, partial [Acidobacteriota bacterium]
MQKALIYAILAAVILLLSWHFIVKADLLTTYQSLDKKEKQTSEPPGGGKQRDKFFFKQRAFPFNAIPLDARMKALEHTRRNVKLAPQLATPLKSIGPAPIGGQPLGNRQENVSGRVTALAVDPQNPTTIYLGGAQGGLWRSTNSGQNWQPMTDNAPTLSIGAIAIDPTNRDIIYLGTGDGSLGFSGLGILKSTDRGQTWANLATQTFVGRAFNKLLIAPDNTRVLYAAIGFGGAGITFEARPELARNGIYRSTDAGISWTNILEVGSANTQLGNSAFDLEMDKTNPAVLYATINRQGIFKSTNGGTNWVKLTNGLPSGNFTRIDVTVAKSNPNILYASFGGTNLGGISVDDLLAVFKSTDGGNNWNTIGRPKGLLLDGSYVCVCSFVNYLEVDPINPDIVYFGGAGLSKSIDGGQSWTLISNNIHPDFHAMLFLPNSPNQFYVGTDGGVWFTENGGSTFINRNNDLSLTQFQSIALHPTDPNIAIGGTQDNGINLFTGSTRWQYVDGGDGGFTAIDQTTPNVMYNTDFNIPGIVIGPRRSDEGGSLESWQPANAGINQNEDVLFYAPFILDPNNQSTLYFGSFRLYRSTNQGRRWQPISERLTNREPFSAISAIAVAPGAPQIIYTGSSDGAIFTSIDGGRNFKNVTGNLPLRYITDIVIDPVEPMTVYVSLSGFRAGHIFKSTSGGRNWQDISGNLPDSPTNALVINPLNSQQLFAGTDIGLFQTDNGGANWMLVPGMPTVNVFDIAINANLGLVRIATHGRGVYQLKLDKDTITPTVTVSAPNGNETLMANSQSTITWSSRDNIGVMRHDIALSTDSGNTFPITIATGLAGNTQLFLWNIPAIETKQARIRVTAFDGANNQGVDVSNSDFSISNGDFAILPLPTRQVISAGESTSFTINVQSLAGFAQAVSLNVTVPDTTITATLSSGMVIPGNSASLKIDTTTATANKTFSIIVTGTANQIVHTSTVTVDVMAVVSPDFSLAFDTPQINVSRGQRGQFTVNINRTGGFSGNVTVTAPDTKALKIRLTPASQSTTG